MKKWIALLAAVLCLTSFTACSEIDPQKLVSQFDQAVGALGQSQITKDKNLIGTRVTEKDDYTGYYYADCKKKTGRDVVFGGASVENRTVRVFGSVQTTKGTAALRIRLGEDVEYLEVDEDGFFDETLLFDGGGNYVMVEYDDFTGEVHLCAEYVNA